MRKAMTSAALACLLGGWSLAAQAGHFADFAGAQTDVRANGDGTYEYAVSAWGDYWNGRTPDRQLVDFYLPYFGDMGIADITATDGWSVTIEASNDVFGLGAGAGVLHFHDALPQYYGGFTFQADYAGTEGPFHSMLLDESTGEPVPFWGDPLIPASPDTLRALSAVPEPAPVASLLAGLVVLGGAALRRRVSGQSIG